jgi:deazaflavin-dependent oxidoreductase (nitroreductase family)
MSDEHVQVTFEGMAKLTEEVISEPGPRPWTQRFNASVIEAFRANGGHVPGELAVIDFLLLTTVGAKTGAPRTVPLGYFMIDGRMVVVASMGGADRHPPWFHNLRAHPEVTIELGEEVFQATAVITAGADRDDPIEQPVAIVPAFAEYRARTTRVIPVVELKRSDVAEPAGAQAPT